MSKELKFNENARVALKKGIDKLAEAVRMTLGPRGRAVVIEKGYGAPQVTFDGVTVAKEIELEDKYENLGAEFIKQAADKTDDYVGDGTTSSVVLAHAMIDEGERAIKELGFNVIQLGEKLKEAASVVITSLDAQKLPITEPTKIREVATLSSKDAEIGKLIAEVMAKIGKEGVVTIEDSNTIGNSYEMVEGMQFDKGYVSQYMVTNQEKMEASLEDPYVLVTDKKISSIQEILPLLEKMVQSGKKELLIVAEEIDGEALATLVLNKLRGIFNVLAVKAPGFGDRRKEMLQDIAIVVGGEFISEELGKKLDTATLDDLGRAHRVVAGKDVTTIVGGHGDKKAIEDRVAQLKAQIKKVDSDFDKEKLQERLGKLSGGVAVLKVGAPTESAQKELKDRVQDAVSATRAAMEEGIVPGGGMALYNVHLDYKQPGLGQNEKVFEAAKAIINFALKAPARAIIENSGASSQNKLEEIEKKKNTLREKIPGDSNAYQKMIWIGFDALNNNIVEDLRDVGIIDPLKVVKTAFLNAISVAANYLMIGAAVVEIPKKESGQAGGGMPEMGY